MDTDIIRSPGTPPDKRAADPDAGRDITELFREHHLGLVRLALLVVGDLGTAEDAVQDAFEQLHRRWRSLRKESSALDYARSAVLNRCRSISEGAVRSTASRGLAALARIISSGEV